MFGIDDAVMGAVAGGLISNVFAGERQNDAQAFAGQQAGQSQAFNAEQAQQQRDWEEHMSDTAFQRGTKDMMAAGLNPMLAYMHGSASTPSGAAASSSPIGAGIASPGNEFNIAAGMQTASNIKLQDEQAKLASANAEKAQADAAEARARTPTYQVNIEATRAKIDETTANIQKIIQETATSANSAQNIAQQTINLQAVLPQIKAATEQLRSLSNLNRAQAIEAGAKTTVSDATYDEIRQRIRAGLPQLDASIKTLEAKAQNLSMPRRGMEAAANDSFIGALGAVLRTLNPLGSLINATR